LSPGARLVVARCALCRWPLAAQAARRRARVVVDQQAAIAALEGATQGEAPARSEAKARGKPRREAGGSPL
jgi:hypothetical protein